MSGASGAPTSEIPAGAIVQPREVFSGDEYIRGERIVTTTGIFGKGRRDRVGGEKKRGRGRPRKHPIVDDGDIIASKRSSSSSVATTRQHSSLKSYDISKLSDVNTNAFLEVINDEMTSDGGGGGKKAVTMLTDEDLEAIKSEKVSPGRIPISSQKSAYDIYKREFLDGSGEGDFEWEKLLNANPDLHPRFYAAAVAWFRIHYNSPNEILSDGGEEDYIANAINKFANDSKNVTDLLQGVKPNLPITRSDEITLFTYCNKILDSI